MLRLDLVSPLPPVRSGIADYMADLLPHLAARADVRVLVLPRETPARAILERLPSAPLATAADEGRLPLYQMGNNPHHVAVEERALRVPGVLVLHDVVLHHFLLGQTLGYKDLPPYVDALAAEHGWIGEAVATAKAWGGYSDLATFLLPAHRRLLRRQRGVLVHSHWAASRLAEEDPAIRVAPIPMAVPLPPPADPATRRDARRRLGVPEDALLLGSFGFQTPMKRPEVALAALAAPGLERVHLVLAGEVAPTLDLEAEARVAGVADRVHVTGYLPYAELEAAIAAADVCLNLRYPSAGETSASLLRILALGRPAIVSDYAQFAELPPHVVLKVPLAAGEELPALVAAIAGLAGDPERRARLGERARALVAAEHDPGVAADAVVEACAAWRDAVPPGDAPPRPEPPTTLAWSRLGGRLEVAGTERPWAAGERRRLRLRLVNDGPARWLAGERGPGGVVLELRLLAAGGRDLLAGRPWLPLPRDLAPGEEATIETEVRRPPGDAVLHVEPHVLGRAGFGALGGPTWASAL